MNKTEMNFEPQTLPAVENSPEETAAQEPPKQQAAPVQEKPRPVYAGRITLGISLIAVGLLVTASLFLDTVDLLWVARLAPLILVLLGIEVLVSSFRSQGRPVKVGFGLTLLSLVLIFGAVGAAILPEVWMTYGPGKWEHDSILRTELEQDIYAQMDGSRVDWIQADMMPLGSSGRYRSSVEIELIGEYESAEDFARAALPVLHSLDGLELNTVYLHSNENLWTVNVQGQKQIGSITEKELTGRVEHFIQVEDPQGIPYTISEEEYERRQQEGSLIARESVEELLEKSRQEGFDEGWQQGHEEGLMEGHNRGYSEGHSDALLEDYVNG